MMMWRIDVHVGFLALCLSGTSVSSKDWFEISDNIGYFWHVTDFHLDTNYSVGSQQNRDYFIGDYPYDICWGKAEGPFGDYNCDAPELLVKSAISFIKGQSQDNPQYKFVIWTGDDTAHAGNEYFSEELSLGSVERITDLLRRGLDLPIFPVLGNHDALPHNQLSDDKNNILYQKTGDWWKDLVQVPGWFDNYRQHAGFYEIKMEPWYRIIGVNSNLWYMSNHVTENMPDPGEQFSWLREVLAQSRLLDEKVLLIAHIPPGKFERFYQFYAEENQFGFPWFRKQFNDEYLSILEEFSDVIYFQLYGHHHTDTFKIMKKGDGEPYGFGLLAPAVSPGRSTLANETGATNPSLRLFKFDNSTGEILDFTQFWLDLDKANTDGIAEWKMEYTFKEYFGLEALTLDEINRLSLKLHDDPETFDKYYLINGVQKVEYECDDICRSFQYCSITEQDYDMFEACLNDEGINNETVTTPCPDPMPTTTSTSGSRSVTRAQNASFATAVTAIVAILSVRP